MEMTQETAVSRGSWVWGYSPVLLELRKKKKQGDFFPFKFNLNYLASSMPGRISFEFQNYFILGMFSRNVAETGLHI